MIPLQESKALGIKMMYDRSTEALTPAKMRLRCASGGIRAWMYWSACLSWQESVVSPSLLRGMTCQRGLLEIYQISWSFFCIGSKGWLGCMRHVLCRCALCVVFFEITYSSLRWKRNTETTAEWFKQRLNLTSSHEHNHSRWCWTWIHAHILCSR